MSALLRILLIVLVAFCAHTFASIELESEAFRLLTATDPPTEAPSEAPSEAPTLLIVDTTRTPTHVHVEVPAPLRRSERERIVIDMPGPDKIEYVRTASKTATKAKASKASPKAPTATKSSTKSSKTSKSKSKTSATDTDSTDNSVDAVRARVEESKKRMKAAFDSSMDL